MIGSYLQDILIIFAGSALVVFLFGKIRIPSIVGFLVTGGLLGPSGFSLVQDREVIEVLAEIGVALLLFTVGLEFSMTKIIQMGKMVFIGGSIQVLVTIGIVTVGMYLVFGQFELAVFTGMLVSLSSTAVVLKLLMDKGEVHTKQGADITSLLVFQDMAVIPMMLITPMLVGGKADVSEFIKMGGTGLLLIFAVVVGTKWVVPWVLHETVKTRNRELFVIVVLILSLGTAHLSHLVGLSLALGAFLAGMMISDSEYSHQVVADILPFRDSLNSLFFVSIGMLLDLHYAIDNIGLVLILSICVVLVKFPAAALPSVIFKYPFRFGIVTGLSLSQIGEFSFILLQFGKRIGLDLGDIYQPFLAAAVLTMGSTPFMMKLGEKLRDIWIDHRSKSGKKDEADASPFGVYEKIKGHVVIIGFGLNGQNLARVLKATGISYNILEMNPATVRKFAALGEPIHYGDATRERVLSHAGIETARVLVVAISDPAMERRVVPLARQMNHALHIVARMKYVTEIEPLLRLGADEVITEEFETSIEILAHVLHVFGVTNEVVGQQVESVRSSAYMMLRSVKEKPESPDYTAITEKFTIVTYRLPSQCASSGKTLKEISLHEKSGAMVIAVERQGTTIASPQPDFELKTGDVLHLAGNSRQLNKAVDMIAGKE
ncbi:MAG: cation:proton antiporter [Nitrospinota bacterium]|nr:cation:proton antiporter [Nitrospinota bacterium]